MKRDYTEIEIPVTDVGEGLNVSGFVDPDYREHEGHRRASKRILLCLGSAAVVLLAVILLSTLKVKSVTVVGNRAYSESEIAALSCISVGDGFFAADASLAESSILDGCPLVSSVSVKKSFPSGVTIEITEDELSYYIGVEERWYSLSTAAKVIEEARYPDRFTEDGLLYVILPEDTVISVGARISSSDEDKDLSYIEDFLKALREFERSGAIGYPVAQIDLSGKFNISLFLEDSTVILLGGVDRLEDKLRISFAALEDARRTETRPLTVNATDPDEVTTRVRATE